MTQVDLNSYHVSNAHSVESTLYTVSPFSCFTCTYLIIDTRFMSNLSLKFTFCNFDSSEANDLALRLARQYTQHEDVVVLDQ